jgi:hypothetical protein
MKSNVVISFYNQLSLDIKLNPMINQFRYRDNIGYFDDQGTNVPYRNNGSDLQIKVDWKFDNVSRNWRYLLLTHVGFNQNSPTDHKYNRVNERY